MKKNTTKIFIAAVFLTISGTAFAQEGRVGINTSTPAATLDVVASPSNATRIDGFIAPRLKGSELKAKDDLYTTAQDGAIVYVTEAVSGVTDKTTNVTSIGYYYFDKTQGTAGRWMKIANPTTIPIVIGVLRNTAPSIRVNSANYNTGAYIDLPAGKWVVNSTMLLRKTESLLANDAALWIRAGFSTSDSSFIQAGNILSGSLVGPSNFGLMNGIVVINNASGSTQRYYLWKLPSWSYGSATGAEVLAYFGGTWGENQIVATPVN